MEHFSKILLTPGPLTTSDKVKESMMVDYGTRDISYELIVAMVKDKILKIAHATNNYECILLQGSGTYGVESVLNSTIGKEEKVLILSNGAYGQRMANIMQKANKPYEIVEFSNIKSLYIAEIEKIIANSNSTHVAFIHSETTAGVLNDIVKISKIIKKYDKQIIVDAMSSFGGIDINVQQLDIDYLITSSNKCLHGVPGLSIIIAKKQSLDECKDKATSLSLDLYEQYLGMKNNTFRFTSPTHVLSALNSAIDELIEIGGVNKRYETYLKYNKDIKEFMLLKGFKTLVDDNDQSMIITTYLMSDTFNFNNYYDYMKENGFLLYSGKLSNYNAFRIGNIGNISEEDIDRFKLYTSRYLEINNDNR